MPESFDVFVSYSSQDRLSAQELYLTLKAHNLRPWIDTKELRPGLTWQDGIEAGLLNSRSCAILIGAQGLGPWHRKEMQLALTRQGPTFPVIPVLLPSASFDSDDTTRLDSPYDAIMRAMPRLISLLTWVDLRRGLHDRTGIERLLWGVTGRRPREVQILSDVASSFFEEEAYSISSPRNGDLVQTSSEVFGTGPANEPVFLYCRAQDAAKFEVHGRSRADLTGHWQIPFELSAFQSLSPGKYELYASGVQGDRMSQPVTIALGDEKMIGAAHSAEERVGNIAVSAYIRSSHLRTTKLTEGRILKQIHKFGARDDLQMLASGVAADVAAFFESMITSKPLRVEVQIDESGNVSIVPPNTEVLYYAFPRSLFNWLREAPSTDLYGLYMLTSRQRAWQVETVDGVLPDNPFSSLASRHRVTAANEYLEIRYEGYRPAHIPLRRRRRGRYEVTLQPVLNRRIAVLSFPAVTPTGTESSSIPQLIASRIVHALEGSKKIATYGYLLEASVSEGMERFSKSDIEVGNEVLTLSDVAMIEQQLDELDVAMISGEGRHLRRRESEIHFTVRGTYTLIQA